MEIWPSIYSELSKSTDSQLNSAILGKIEFREILNDDTIVLCAPDEFTKGWFSENFLHSAQVISKTLFEKNYQFRIEVVNEKSFTEVKERGKKAQKPSIYSMNLNPMIKNSGLASFSHHRLSASKTRSSSMPNSSFSLILNLKTVFSAALSRLNSMIPSVEISPRYPAGSPVLSWTTFR